MSQQSLPRLNPLARGGTHQFERLSEALHQDYVQLEERHEKELLEQAAILAEKLQYYDTNNVPQGDWRTFFDEATPDSKPPKALFIAFLRLLELLHAYANGLTQRHLDYYYKEVLHFVKREAQPTQVHVFFECAKTLKHRLLEKGALLRASSDGKQLFALVDELVVNTAVVAHCKTVYQEDATFGNKLFAQTHLPQAEEDEPWSAFGESQLTYVQASNGEYVRQLKTPDQQTMTPAEVGWAIASPLLRLSEGRRHFDVSLYTNATSLPQNFTTSFRFWVTTEEGWWEVAQNTVRATVSTDTQNQVQRKVIRLEISLPDTAPAITNYTEETHQGSYGATCPLLKVVLDHDQGADNSPFPYAAWKQVTIRQVGIQVIADDLASLIIQSDLATWAPGRPFRPFAPQPALGDNLYLGHPDLFNAPLKELKLHLNWKEVPADLGAHYTGYTDTGNSITNTSFQVTAALRDEGTWKALGNGARWSLFDTNAKQPHTIAFDDADLRETTRQADAHTFDEWDLTVPQGFLRLTLAGVDHPQMQAFGHQRYTTLLTQQGPQAQLAPPYTPQIASLTVSYMTEEIVFDARDSTGPDTLYHVTPWGQAPLGTLSPAQARYLLPQYTAEGYCYIGLQQVTPPQSVSILFQIAPGSAQAERTQLNTDIRWSYLAGNQWKPLEDLNISQDTTTNLLHTGVMRFDLPSDMDDVHTLMPGNTLWLRAAVPAEATGIDRVVGIHAQAGIARQVDPAAAPHPTLAPDSIQGLDMGQRGIAAVEQPYPSWGGRPGEDAAAFYTRTSERLRHKDRGIMIWDYERLALERFPAIYKVKCLNHTHPQSEWAPGHVLLAVVPNLRNHRSRNPFQPKAGLHRRTRLHQYLQPRMSPFIQCHVVDPHYEPLMISMGVGLHPGYDAGYYGQQLHQAVQAFLSPWAFEEGHDLAFGGKMHRATLLKFIEDLPYVNFVQNFTLFHFYQDAGLSNHWTNGRTQEGPCDVLSMEYNAETIQRFLALRLKVRFYRGLINDDPATRLERELNNILESRDRRGELLTKTLLMTLINTFHYVDQVVDLQLYYWLPDGWVMEEVDTAVAKTSRSILVSHQQHAVQVYQEGEAHCQGSVGIGIGQMVVDVDFIAT